MPPFRFFEEDEEDFGFDFGLRESEDLLPMPATTAATGGDPRRITGGPSTMGPRRITGGPSVMGAPTPASPGGTGVAQGGPLTPTPRATGNGPGLPPGIMRVSSPMTSQQRGPSSFRFFSPSERPDFGPDPERDPTPRSAPPTIDGGRRGNTEEVAPDGGVPGRPDIEALRAAFARDFPLGGSDLSDPRIQDEASRRFQEIITAMGGSKDLRGEIGDARFVNRLQEFIGKGTTLDQSGRISIGNDIILESLRDLADFNQPVADSGPAPPGMHRVFSPSGGGDPFDPGGVVNRADRRENRVERRRQRREERRAARRGARRGGTDFDPGGVARGVGDDGIGFVSSAFGGAASDPSDPSSIFFSEAEPFRGFDSAQEEFDALTIQHQRNLDNEAAGRGQQEFDAQGNPIAFSDGGARRFLRDSSLAGQHFEKRSDMTAARLAQLENFLGGEGGGGAGGGVPRPGRKEIRAQRRSDRREQRRGARRGAPTGDDGFAFPASDGETGVVSSALNAPGLPAGPDSFANPEGGGGTFEGTPEERKAARRAARQEARAARRSDKRGGTSVVRIGAGGGAGYQRLLEIANGDAFDDDLFNQTAGALRGELQHEREIAIDQMQEFLASRGITGSGVEGAETEDIAIELNRQMGQRLTETALAMGLAAGERQLGAAQAASAAELERSAQAIAQRQIDMTFAIAQMQNDTTMALGQGRLALDNLAMNAAFAEAMLGSRINAGSLIQALQLAASGQGNDAIRLLVTLADQLRGGRV